MLWRPSKSTGETLGVAEVEKPRYDHRVKGTGDLVGSDGGGWGTEVSWQFCIGFPGVWVAVQAVTLWGVVTVKSRSARCFPTPPPHDRRMGSGCQNGPSDALHDYKS